MVLRRIARNSVVRAIAARVVSRAVRTKVSAAVVKTPDVELFQKMLSKQSSMVCVPGRVLMVCGSLQPGGAERQVANTLVGLTGSSLESVTLLCDYLDGDAPEKRDFYLPLARSSGFTVRAINTSRGELGDDAMLDAFRDVAAQLHPSLADDITNLYHEMRLLRPEVVHAWLDWSNVRAGLAAVLAGVPKIILSGRNLNPTHFAFSADYFHPAYSALAQCGDERVVILNNSQAGADDYAGWLNLPLERIKVVRNGIQFVDDMRPSREHDIAFRASIGVPPTAPLVGGMFRFSPEKQPLLWLETAAKIARVLPDAHFVLFGQGSMLDTMEARIEELDLTDRTHLYGVITPSLRGLSPCDLIMMTSREEGTPNVLLEAQWLGVPVVTTDAGGAREAILHGVTGIVTSRSEADVIASAAVTVLQSEDFGRVARRRGPAFISERYSMQRMISETLALYQGGESIFHGNEARYSTQTHGSNQFE